MGLWIARGLLAVQRRSHLGRELPGRRRALHHQRFRLRPRDAHDWPQVDDADDANSARILLVDDEVAIQRALGPLLRARGYDVEIAGTGADALRAFEDRHPRPGRARPRPARHRRHRGLPPNPADIEDADRRAVGARRPRPTR